MTLYSVPVVKIVRIVCLCLRYCLNLELVLQWIIFAVTAVSRMAIATRMTHCTSYLLTPDVSRRGL